MTYQAITDEPTFEWQENLAYLSQLCDDDPFEDIPNWENEYAVSPRGEIYSYKSKSYLHPIKKKTGYCVVNLKREHHYIEQHFVHRLVAEAFIPNPWGEQRPIVNHIDEDKTNNWATNLEWCTVDYNNRYGTARERGALSNSVPIVGIDPQGKEYYFTSQTEAERQTGIQAANIWKVMNFIRPQAGGWEWYYQDYYWHMIEGFMTDEERSASLDDLCDRHGGLNGDLPDWYVKPEDRVLFPLDPLVHYV